MKNYSLKQKITISDITFFILFNVASQIVLFHETRTTLNQTLLSFAMTAILLKVKQSWCQMFDVDHRVLDYMWLSLVRSIEFG